MRPCKHFPKPYLPSGTTDELSPSATLRTKSVNPHPFAGIFSSLTHKKYSPIGVQGGNNAIEDAATLTNALINLTKSSPKPGIFADSAAVIQAFAAV